MDTLRGLSNKNSVVSPARPRNDAGSWGRFSIWTLDKAVQWVFNVYIETEQAKEAEMLNRAAVHEHRTHPYSIGLAATGYLGAGGSARFTWDGEMWQPDGRTDAASLIGPLTDAELRRRLCPDLDTIFRLGPHWGSGSRFAEDA